MKRWDVINHFLQRDSDAPYAQPVKRYLEIGVESGECAKHVIADVKVGVDPQPLPGAWERYTTLNHMTSDEYFSMPGLPPLFDVIFIDGLHHADQVVKDVRNSLTFLRDDGVILLHDCNPVTEIAQLVPRKTVHWNGDVWKVIAELRKHSGIVYTIDCDEGIGVVSSKVKAIGLHPQDWTYDMLEKNRREILGLVSPKEVMG